MVLEAADKSNSIRADHAEASIAPLALPTADTSHDAGTATLAPIVLRPRSRPLTVMRFWFC